MTPTNQTGEIDAELRNLVEQAFPATNVDVVAAEGSDASPAYRSDDAEAAWKRMHDAAKGREIAVLLEMLDGTWLGGEERWKAVTFLGYSLRTPEAQGERESILQSLAGDSAVKQRGTVPNDVLRLQRAALLAVAESPVGADAKWQFMLDAVQASRTHFREILEALSAFRPSSTTAIADASPILIDAMVRSDRSVDLDSLARLVRDLDVRSAAPDLRRLLLAASLQLSARVAPILADWRDAEAALELRRAITQFSTTSDPDVDELVDSLYRLQGSACDEFLAGTFRSAPAALQEHLLDHSLRKIPSAAITKEVRKLAESTKDVDLKKAAKAYLDAPPPAAVESAPAVSTGAAAAPKAPGAGPAAAAPATPGATGTAGSWQPVYEDTSAPPPGPSVAPAPSMASATPVAPAPAAAPAPPVAPAPPAAPPAPAPAAAAPPPASSWQPAVDDPQAASTAGTVGGDDVVSRRAGIDAEMLARFREEAEAERLAEEERAKAAGGPDPLEFLVRLPQILFGLALLAALLALVLGGGGE